MSSKCLGKTFFSVCFVVFFKQLLACIFILSLLSSNHISMSDYKCKNTQLAEVINSVKWSVILNKYNIYFQLLL